MAWGAPTNIGTGQNKVSSTTVVLTTTVALNVDDVAVIIIAADNFNTTDGDFGEVTSISDSSTGGNAWAKAKEFTNGQGAAAAGATVSMWYSKITNAVANGGTVTANFGNAIVAKGITGFKATIGAGNVVSVAASTTLANDAADPGSMDLTPPNVEHMWVRGTALERATTTWTNTVAYELNITGQGTTGGGAATNMDCHGECDRLTGTTNPSNPTATAVDCASVLVALLEAAPAAFDGASLGLTSMLLCGVGR